MTKTSVVLFSGGSASNLLAVQLERQGLSVTNVLTVFDNGGSTGELRRIAAIPMPAMGDIRNRLVALAAESTDVYQGLKRLFDFRFSETKASQQLNQELNSVLNLSNRLMSGLPELQRNSILGALRSAVKVLPQDFSLQRQSLGNLLLFGRALERGDFLEAVNWARELLGVVSEVLPVTLESAHLGARLETGRWILGQAELTKEVGYHLPGRIERLCLLEEPDTFAFEAKAPACHSVIEAIRRAEALVIGFGSFFTSILPHFLVRGVGAEFRRLDKPKILLCNPTLDRESENVTVQVMVDTLSKYAARDRGATGIKGVSVTHIVHFLPNLKTSIPKGDLAEFSAAGGHYKENNRAKSFEEIAAYACESVVTCSGMTTSRPIQRTTLSRSHTVPVVVLFDLDVTLFDYSMLRVEATSAALDGVVDDPERISEQLAEILRPPFTDLLSTLGLPDLRLKWDSPEVFAVALILADSSLRPLLEVTIGTARTISSAEDASSLRGQLQLARKLSQMKSTHSLLNALRDIIVHSDHGSFAAQRTVFGEYVRKNAVLAPGAEEIISRLRKNADIHIVSEGDSHIQDFKFNSLGLQEMVQTCVVSDSTCGIGPVLRELREFLGDQEEIPDGVAKLYDALKNFSEKSVPFFVKLLHALADQEGNNLPERVKSHRFLTVQEWEESFPPSVVMVGDRYEKDIEPFLRACKSGARAFRIVRGRYANQFPLHELIAEKRVLPDGEFADLRQLCDPLAGLVKEFREPMQRPSPILPDPELIEEAVRLYAGLPHGATDMLLGLKSEALRQREAR